MWQDALAPLTWHTSAQNSTLWRNKITRKFPFSQEPSSVMYVGNQWWRSIWRGISDVTTIRNGNMSVKFAFWGSPLSMDWFFTEQKSMARTVGHVNVARHSLAGNTFREEDYIWATSSIWRKPAQLTQTSPKTTPLSARFATRDWSLSVLWIFISVQGMLTTTIRVTNVAFSTQTKTFILGTWGDAPLTRHTAAQNSILCRNDIIDQRKQCVE